MKHHVVGQSFKKITPQKSTKNKNFRISIQLQTKVKDELRERLREEHITKITFLQFKLSFRPELRQSRNTKRFNLPQTQKYLTNQFNKTSSPNAKC